MPSIGPTELIVVLVLALLILGPKRLPEAGRGIGRGLREFKEGIAGRGQTALPAADPASSQREEQASPEPLRAA